jgi:hypothetical protein
MKKKILMSLLRIIIGVLVGVLVAVCFFGGLAFLIRLFHITIPFAKADFIGRCIDTAIPLALGIFGLIYYPIRTAKDIKSGKKSEAEAKLFLKKNRIFCCLIILLGLVQLSEFFYQW